MFACVNIFSISPTVNRKCLALLDNRFVIPDFIIYIIYKASPPTLHQHQSEQGETGTFDHELRAMSYELRASSFSGYRKLSPTLHQHQGEQGEAETFQYSDKQFSVHSSTRLGHTAHHSERACDGGEYCDEDFEELFPVYFHCD